MKATDLPLGVRPSLQMLLIGVAAPIAVIALLLLAVGELPRFLERPPGASEYVAGSLLLGLFIVTTAFMYLRQSITVDGGQLVIAHSFYTLRLRRSDFETVSVDPQCSRPERLLRWKINGIALPGYRSGHFAGDKRSRIFCAYSAGPCVSVVCTGRDTRPSIRLVLSSTPAVLEQLQSWSRDGAPSRDRKGAGDAGA